MGTKKDTDVVCTYVAASIEERQTQKREENKHGKEIERKLLMDADEGYYEYSRLDKRMIDRAIERYSMTKTSSGFEQRITRKMK